MYASPGDVGAPQRRLRRRPLCSRIVGLEPLNCFVEIPKGSRNKYEWDPELKAIKLDRFLFSSVVYPTDYGFIPQTLAGDGDPLDALVCVSEPTFPCCFIPVHAVAVFRMHDEEGQDDKIVCVPHEDPHWNEMNSLDDLPAQIKTEIEHFFSIYKQPEGKAVEIGGWYDRDVAVEILEDCHQRWSDSGESGDQPLARAETPPHDD
jgi:inorganic pyrophosphatase